MKPTADDFRACLNNMLASAEGLGFRAVEIRAGDLHRRVGGYRDSNHRMANCCSVLRQAMKHGDTVVEAPRSGQGASLVVRYCFPR